MRVLLTIMNVLYSKTGINTTARIFAQNPMTPLSSRSYYLYCGYGYSDITTYL